MKCVRFWGTRGSLPVALTASGVRRKVVAALRGAAGRRFASDDDLDAYVDTLGMPLSGSYGGHSSCVEIETGGPDYVLCDMGSGLRPFGQQVIARHGRESPQTYHVFMSHVHWDHIMGFPFFTPAYVPGNRIRIYGGHTVLEEALRRQQSPPSSPVTFSTLRADIEFVHLEPGREYDLAGMTVSLMLQRHSGDSYGYRFASQGKTVIYSTDSEPKMSDAVDTVAFVEFFRAADLVIFDAMYSLADTMSVKADWGHSSNIAGVELCQMRVRGTCACSITNRCTTTKQSSAFWPRRAASRRSPAAANLCWSVPLTTAWKSAGEPLAPQLRLRSAPAAAAATNRSRPASLAR